MLIRLPVNLTYFTSGWFFYYYIQISRISSISKICWVFKKVLASFLCPLCILMLQPRLHWGVGGSKGHSRGSAGGRSSTESLTAPAKGPKRSSRPLGTLKTRKNHSTKKGKRKKGYNSKRNLFVLQQIIQQTWLNSAIIIKPPKICRPILRTPFINTPIMGYHHPPPQMSNQVARQYCAAWIFAACLKPWHFTQVPRSTGKKTRGKWRFQCPKKESPAVGTELSWNFSWGKVVFSLAAVASVKASARALKSGFLHEPRWVKSPNEHLNSWLQTPPVQNLCITS